MPAASVDPLTAPNRPDDEAPHQRREERGQQHGGEVGFANRHAAFQSDFHQQQEHDELVDRVGDRQTRAEGRDQDAAQQERQRWRLQLCDELGEKFQ